MSHHVEPTFSIFFRSVRCQWLFKTVVRVDPSKKRSATPAFRAFHMVETWGSISMSPGSFGGTQVPDFSKHIFPPTSPLCILLKVADNMTSKERALRDVCRALFPYQNVSSMCNHSLFT